MVFGVCYTQAMISDSPRARAEKTKCSNLARQRMNFRTAWQKLRLLLCCNFSRWDLYITFGYDDDHLPPNRKCAKKYMQRFIDQLRSARRNAGEDLKYIYVTEELKEDGTRRLHHHLIINAGADRKDFELIRSLWKCGSNIEIRKLGEHELYSDDFLELAQYLCKERNPDQPFTVVGDKCWVPSRNLAKPEPHSELVDDNVTITAPPGANVIDRDHKDTVYGSYDYIVYLLPEKPPAKPRSPRKKE
ncbi:MAG: hypothetical protein EOM54_05690 [Clostridia bacterium]|nr:hypothetical protein [Clostridia bacterium]